MSDESVRVGASACLLGQEVRYDGGHRHSRGLMEVLAKRFELVPVCPEVEVGMGVPRETVRLLGDANSPLMVGSGSEKDWTLAMKRFARRRVLEHDLAGLSGFVLKRGSPSCGTRHVEVHGADGVAKRTGVGLFARVLMDCHPLLPVVEEGPLEDSELRKHFVMRVCAYHRMQSFFDGRPGSSELADFHARHEELLRAHSPALTRELGHIVTGAEELGPGQARALYSQGFMEALRRPVTPPGGGATKAP